MAAKVRANGRQALAIIPLDVADPRPEVIARDEDDNFDQRGGRRIVSWDWIDDDNLLIWLTARSTLQGQDVTESRVVAYNRRTRQTTQLGWRDALVNAGNVIWRSREGRPRILISRNASGRGFERINNQEVIEVDVESGRQEVVISPQRGIQNWYADGAGNVRLGTSFDPQTGVVTARYRSEAGGNFRTIISERMQRYRDPPVPIIFLPNDRAIVLSRHENFSGVYEMDLNRMEFVRRVYGVDGYDVADVTPNVDRTGIGRISVVEDRLRQHYEEPRLREIQQILDETYGPGNAFIVSADRAREKLIIRVGAPNQAGGFYLYETETGNLRHIGWVNTELRDMPLNPVRTIRYRTTDGKTIAAVLTLPRRREHRNLPLIVMPHGGPWARDDESFDMWAQPLAEMGYAVVQPNFRGSSGYGYEWEAASDGNWGLRMQDDLVDAISHLANEGIADRGRVCIMGWSYGGYAASRAAQRDGQHYRCAISGAGVHDLPTMVAYDRDYLGRHGSQYLGSAASRLAEVSPARFPQQYSIPILIVHGARDERVPVAQSRDLVARLRNAGKVEGRDFVYLEQPRNTHNLPLEEDRVQFIEAVQRFLAEHNPA
ncbi:prolyl oligopeptidase family serine peptidase [Sphingosinicella sp. YJ22]|uniref:alpha/beta hydrolase family protein n=1 Tax=Sphingosinicella sp. YJ22 TaxID=1104780 RepID=UPI001409A04F|nr:prolyl oligopeptidase family serine peptidase [Sphingosinicella sp. YJ22]